MGGKSTYLRQTALLCVMAQAGSFVPAREAKMPLVDRIFARVGASDNIARGHSTFMVEMQETANILHTATVAQPGRARRDRPRHGDLRRPEHRVGGRRVPRDAIRRCGRRRCSPRIITSSPISPTRRPASSTSTSRRASGRTTSSSCARSCRADPDRSYGIQVARLAGLPATVVARAREILGGARARRADARRPAVGQRHPVRPAAAARPVPRARDARRSASRADRRRSTSTG